MALITVFTPTYNRGNLIHRCYESLRSQTSNNFEWLIIDDGSTDCTGDLVKQWQKEENPFNIRYIYKENGGLHTGYNEAIRYTCTELFTCIDSDDWMPPHAIERIESIWNEVASSGYTGIMGIDRFEDGACVGDLFPENVTEMFLYEKLVKYRIKGDKKLIYRTDLLKKVAPMPSFPGEKHFNPSYLMYLIDRFGKLYVTNECFCVVDYQPDGMSSNIFKQYADSPNSFAQTRLLYLSFPGASIWFRFRQCVHYVSSCLLSGRFFLGIKESPYPVLTSLAIIPGFLLTFIVKLSSK